MPGNRRTPWSRDETLVALHTYLTISFGKIYATNKYIIDIAAKLGGRTNNAVAMKALNFASIDESCKRTGLTNVAAQDRRIWEEFTEDRDEILKEIGRVLAGFSIQDPVLDEEKEHNTDNFVGPQERTRVMSVKQRLGQRYFRQMVMSAYEEHCGVSGLYISSMIDACHIIPWKEEDGEDRRVDATNGLALNKLLHSAFDMGYMTFDEDWRVCFSKDVKKDKEDNRVLLDWEGEHLNLPHKFAPCSKAMDWHREKVFDRN